MIALVILHSPSGPGIRYILTNSDIQSASKVNTFGPVTPDFTVFKPGLRLVVDDVEIIERDGEWFVQTDGPGAAGRLEIPNGRRTRHGDYEFILLADDWIKIPANDIVIFLKCVPVISHSLYHVGKPVLTDVKVFNPGTVDSAEFSVSFDISDFGDRTELFINTLKPGELISIDTPVINLNRNRLSRLVAPMEVKLIVEVSGKEEVRATRKLPILGCWDTTPDIESLGAVSVYSLPNDPVVEALVTGAQTPKDNDSGRTSFDSILAANEPEPEIKVMERMYEYLKDAKDIQYMNPRFETVQGFDIRFQKMRAPHIIFPNSVNLRGRGTCLDLCLLYTGCLENSGLKMLLIFVGENGKKPKHVVAGCWLTGTASNRPLIEKKKYILDEIGRGHLQVIECTGFAEGAFPEKLDFAKAVSTANSRIMDSESIIAVDFTVCRPPYGSSTPLDSPLAAEVAYAYWAAFEFARFKRRPTLESTQLLYGIVKANGEIIQWLEECGILDREALLSDLEDEVDDLDHDEEPRRTVKFTLTQKLAEMYAEATSASSRGATIRELDLFCAILTVGKYSEAFMKNCKKVNFNPPLVKEALQSKYEGGCLEEISRSIFINS